MVEIKEKLYAKNRSEWRKWLFKNHNKKKEIWLVFYRKHTGKPTVSIQESIDEALCFGWIDSMSKGIDDEKYSLRFSPRSAKSSWSEINTKKYKELLSQGLVAEAGKAAFKK